ncbi:MAG: hypothetical protein SF029_16675 [bacterium]|nr:hypothetical protein [bacterium]
MPHRPHLIALLSLFTLLTLLGGAALAQGAPSINVTPTIVPADVDTGIFVDVSYSGAGPLTCNYGPGPATVNIPAGGSITVECSSPEGSSNAVTVYAESAFPTLPPPTVVPPTPDEGGNNPNPIENPETPLRATNTPIPPTRTPVPLTPVDIPENGPCMAQTIQPSIPVYENPAVDAERITQLQGGELAPVMGKEIITTVDGESENWWWVEVDDLAGWVRERENNLGVIVNNSSPDCRQTPPIGQFLQQCGDAELARRVAELPYQTQVAYAYPVQQGENSDDAVQAMCNSYRHLFSRVDPPPVQVPSALLTEIINGCTEQLPGVLTGLNGMQSFERGFYRSSLSGNACSEEGQLLTLVANCTPTQWEEVSTIAQELGLSITDEGGNCETHRLIALLNGNFPPSYRDFYRTLTQSCGVNKTEALELVVLAVALNVNADTLPELVAELINTGSCSAAAVRDTLLGSRNLPRTIEPPFETPILCSNGQEADQGWISLLIHQFNGSIDALRATYTQIQDAAMPCAALSIYLRTGLLVLDNTVRTRQLEDQIAATPPLSGGGTFVGPDLPDGDAAFTGRTNPEPDATGLRPRPVIGGRPQREFSEAVAAADEADGFINGRLPVLSPDGTRMAYLVNVRDTDGTPGRLVVRVVDLPTADTPTPSPRTFFDVTDRRFNEFETEGWQVVEARLAWAPGTVAPERNVLLVTLSQSPTVPAGDYIFPIYEEGIGPRDLWLSIDNVAGIPGRSPFFSPDGRFFVYERIDGIFRVNLDASLDSRQSTQQAVSTGEVTPEATAEAGTIEQRWQDYPNAFRISEADANCVSPTISASTRYVYLVCGAQLKVLDLIEGGTSDTDLTSNPLTLVAYPGYPVELPTTIQGLYAGPVEGYIGFDDGSTIFIGIHDTATNELSVVPYNVAADTDRAASDIAWRVEEDLDIP